MINFNVITTAVCTSFIVFTLVQARANEGTFSEYAQTVETLSKTADPDYRAVISLVRIPQGTTIKEKWLQSIPLIEYRRTAGMSEPYLMRRSDQEFGSISEIAGRVALEDISEKSKILRSQVGKKPSEQFKIESNTPLQVHYYFRRGVVLPGASAEIHECTLDTSKMPPLAATELRKRIISSGVLDNQDAKYQISEGGYEDYLIEITVNSITKKISWSGKQAPSAARHLANYLENFSEKKFLPPSKGFPAR